ncbi:MAG: hypothetical protein KJ000_18750 [Pirellulaceae bacterium]|nr:hypothetical protein [Pirellulaceae bacterium]
MLRELTAFVVVLSLVSVGWAEDAKVVLKTEVPEEVLVGTPPDVLALLFPDLEKPPEEGNLPKLMVPAGTTNLALKKKVTGSDSRPLIGELKYVTDGVKAGTEESYVELGPMVQWVQIDLEKPTTIYGLYLWHFFREARSYHDVIVQVSDDPEFKTGVTTVFNNDQDNSSKLGIGKDRAYIETNFGKLIDAKGAKGRYVRVYSNGNTANDLNHYIEVEVFGKVAS